LQYVSEKFRINSRLDGFTLVSESAVGLNCWVNVMQRE